MSGNICVEKQMRKEICCDTASVMRSAGEIRLSAFKIFCGITFYGVWWRKKFGISFVEQMKEGFALRRKVLIKSNWQMVLTTMNINDLSLHIVLWKLTIIRKFSK